MRVRPDVPMGQLTGKSPRTLGPEMSDEELQYLMEILRLNKFTGNHLEIGTAAGGTLVKMMRCYDDRTRPHFVVIDTMTYFTNQWEIVKMNLKEHGLDPTAVEFRVARSYDVFKQVEKTTEEYDFIFIDGAHKCQYVMQDLCWSRLLRKGGLLCLHDYAPNTRGVMFAANRFLSKYANYAKVALVDKLLVIRKCEESAVPEIDWTDRWYATLITPLLQFRLSIEKRINRLRARTR
jgi:predicted O-methyltransferase YrrM